MNSILTYSLRQLDMLKEGETTGLVKVRNQGLRESKNLSPKEIIALEDAYKYKADYVYFRRFPNRPSIPQVYIYDFTERNKIHESEYINLHRKLYSSGHVPMFFVFTKVDIKVFNCYRSPADDNQLVYNPLTTIKISSQVLKKLTSEEQKDNYNKITSFSGRKLDNGTFWESSEYGNSFQFKLSAYESLLSELKQALADIIKNRLLPITIARKLMVMAILVKYLEERTDENGNSVFPRAGETRSYTINGKRIKKQFEKSFFHQFASDAKSFVDVLKVKGACIKLFDHLASHFNGGIFRLDQKELEELKNADLTRFAHFFEGKLVNGVQFVFWRLYSFNDLPVELISNIYEEFLEKKPGVVYTPPFLVNFLLDEVMPIHSPQTDFKVLDPACGSGVFLVGAYRRLVHRWRYSNDWEKPTLSTLKQLLVQNIYGIDKDPDAVNLTIFSLSLALCDELTPLQIWEDLKFDDLKKENILWDDFFNLYSKLSKTPKFDLVIGNPPFEAQLTEAAILVNNAQDRFTSPKSTQKRRTQRDKIKLPGEQIALLFLESTPQLCKPEGLTCLIQPSGPLLYNLSSLEFRKHLFDRYEIPQIIDFTHLSRILFKAGTGSTQRGDVATSAVFIKNQPPKANGCLHVVVKRTKPHREKIFFEIDSHDINYVPLNLARHDKYIWKSNLLGGPRYHQLITRLSTLPKLGQYLEEKKKSGWAVSEGFTAATEKDLNELRDLRKQSKNSDEATKEYVAKLKKLRAPFLTGRKFLPTRAFTSEGIDHKKIIPELDIPLFHSKGKKEVYQPPHILIKETIEGSKIPIAYTNEYLTFRHRIIGIHAPSSDVENLHGLYKWLTNSKINIFHIAGTSPEFMVNRSSSFLKSDLLDTPYDSTPESDLLNTPEKILVEDFWNYMIDFRRKGENSKIATIDATKNTINTFSSTYCDVLNNIYPQLKPYSHFEGTSFICVAFQLDKKTEVTLDMQQAEEHLSRIIQHEVGSSLRLIRTLRIYSQNIILLIKPKKLRYWLRSTALRDADETFTDLRKQGF